MPRAVPGSGSVYISSYLCSSSRINHAASLCWTHSQPTSDASLPTSHCHPASPPSCPESHQSRLHWPPNCPCQPSPRAPAQTDLLWSLWSWPSPLLFKRVLLGFLRLPMTPLLFNEIMYYPLPGPSEATRQYKSVPALPFSSSSFSFPLTADSSSGCPSPTASFRPIPHPRPTEWSGRSYPGSPRSPRLPTLPLPETTHINSASLQGLPRASRRKSPCSLHNQPQLWVTHC